MISSTPAPVVGQGYLTQVYEEAIEKNRGVAVSREAFAQRLREIADKYGFAIATPEGQRFIGDLHTADLLLAMGCSQGDPTAWTYFFERFRGLVAQQSLMLIKNPANAEDLWAAALTHAVSAAGGGTVRIACFEGRSSLATWLRALVRNLALTYMQRQQVWNNNEDAGALRDTDHLESSLRERRYAPIIREALEEACNALNPRAHAALVLRYDHGLPLQDIARLLKVHECTVIRQIQQAIRTLRASTFAFLYRRNLSRHAIKECIAELIENPAYSIVQLLNQRPPQLESSQTRRIK